jgi:hypothetical protein
MENVSLEMIWKRLDELKTGQDAIRADLGELKETVQSLARSDVTIQRSMAAMQRDITALKDRVIILTAAIDEHPPAHV